ncbi:hypothetical protein [Nocardia sp. NBC_00416]|uniref:hypothetical protein n=1 Tax=Nocardia sp. NBC_00416 TaxID=2975991 RepID=UPI002E1D1BD9
MPDPEPILDVAGGDIALSRHLSKSLRALADRTLDPGLKSEIRAILAGQGSVRDLMRNESFNQVLDRVLPTMIQRAQMLPDAELRRLAEQGRRELEHLRTQADPPPPIRLRPPPLPAPPVRRDLSPEIVEADDEYFREHHRRGWLV